MSAILSRAGVRPRLSVSFSARDLVAYLGGDLVSGGEEWPPAGYDVHLLTSGRAALYVVLKSLDFPPGSRIGVPLFVCEAVSEAVMRAGHRPVFLDVDPASMVLSPSSIGDGLRLDALIAVHLFGNPVDVESLTQAVECPVIEDCAHALFSEIRGTPVGTRGAGAIYSFGLGKPVSIGRLGAAIVPAGSTSEGLRDLVGQMARESRSEAAYRGLRSFMISTFYRPPWYGMFSYNLGRTLERSLDPMGHQVADFQVSRQGLLSLIRSKLRSYRARIAAQREAWRTLSNVLSDGSADGFLPQTIQTGGVSDQWLFAIRCQSRSQRDALVDALLRLGVDSIKIYDQVPRIARTQYGYGGGAPAAEQLCQTVLAISVASADATTDVPWLAPRLFQSLRGLR